MGTNYYALIPNSNYHTTEVSRLIDPEYNLLHIGKSSAGWNFSLSLPNVYSFDGSCYECREEGVPVIESLSDWKVFLEDKIIVDEYDNLISLEELLSIITERVFNEGSSLKRHSMGGAYDLCVGWGEGTWDYMRGEFS